MDPTKACIANHTKSCPNYRPQAKWPVTSGLDDEMGLLFDLESEYKTLLLHCNALQNLLYGFVYFLHACMHDGIVYMPIIKLMHYVFVELYTLLYNNDGIVCVRRLLYPPLCLGKRSQMGPGKPL